MQTRQNFASNFKNSLDHKMDMWTYIDYTRCFEMKRICEFLIKGGKVMRFTFKIDIIQLRHQHKMFRSLVFISNLNAMGEMCVKKLQLLTFISSIMIITVIMTGCIGSSDDKESDNDIIKMGNVWIYKITDNDFGSGSMTMVVTSESYLYDGDEVAVVDIEFEFDEYSDDVNEVYYDKGDGTGTGFIRKSDFELVNVEFELNIKVKYDNDDDWINMRMEGRTSYTTTGNIPYEIKEGLSFSIEEKSDDDMKIYLNGELVDEDSSDGTYTKNYEVLGKKEITVPAGTFECYEIRVDTVGQDTYALHYYCPEFNMNIKSVEYEGSQLMTMEELESYSIK